MTATENDEKGLQVLESLGRLIGEMFMPHCEVAISDLNEKPARIVYIYNGAITGRKVGDALRDEALENLEALHYAEQINYKKNIVKVGKEIKSSTMIFSFDTTRYSFCVNYDCTLERRLSFALQSFLTMQSDPFEPGDTEDRNVAYIENVVKAEIASMNKTPLDLTRKDRLELVRRLDADGVFERQKSVSGIAEYLGVSRYTIYNDLKRVREERSA